MELKEKFAEDMLEAYDFWITKQDPQAVGEMTFERWATAILQKPVYELLGTKRMENA